jgi:6-pyruvoyl-tetrahydropterin synthase related domain
MMGSMGDQLLESDTAPIGGGDRLDPLDESELARDDLSGPRPRPPLWSRIGNRIVQRPRRWIDDPWTTDRMVRFVVTVLLLGGATFAAVQAVHLDLVFTNNTPTGGDMGAHVMGPAFLRDHLLSNFQLSGWSNYWYAGFPMYRFYMVVPALIIVLLNVVFPYGIAFKIVVISGVVTLPLCCWAFGRLARFRYPMPELFALAGLLLLFDESYSIYGGNVKSTMAGEFSFSIALSLGILGLGLFARGLETGQYRNWAAVVLALACLSHGIVLIFVALGALLLWLVWMDRTRFIYGLTTGITAFLLGAFWVVPFLFNHAYMTDMKYGYRPSGAADSFWDMFFPLTTFFDIFITAFAIFGFVACVARRHLNGAWLGICTLALVAGVYVTRDSLPVIGLLWNPRLLPFVYLLRYLLMMVGLVEFAHVIARGARGVGVLSPHDNLTIGTVVAGVVGVSVLLIELMFFRVMPGAEYQTHNNQSVYQWGPIALSSTSKDALSDSWSRYNFTGYEDKPAYGEYRSLVTTMAQLGEDPGNGCGRAMWENNSDNGKYGTTMALMLLPHWTDGCIASMEGLFFEASGTTPYHFVTVAAMSEKSSNPVRELRYADNDAAVGVPYLQTLGVKYVMVFTEAAKRQADLQPELTLLRQVGPWNVYSVADSDLVVPLDVQPVVVNSRSGDPRERNLELGMSWFQHRDEWAAMPATDGPPGWQRIDVAIDASRDDGLQPGEPYRKVDIVQPTEPIEVVDLPPVTVSDVRLGEQDLSFRVDQIGVPILVKVSYFPNWEVSGAEGPYRIAPNLMVVVPTAKDVHLTYERSGLDLAAYAMTALGLIMLVVWRFRGDVRHTNDSPLGALGAGGIPDRKGSQDGSGVGLFDAEREYGDEYEDVYGLDLSPEPQERGPGSWDDGEPVWADDGVDATGVLQRDELDLTVPADRPVDLSMWDPDAEQDPGIIPPGELGQDPSPPVDRL